MLVKCLKCEKEFNKKESEIRKTSNHFCSKSCSNSYNNIINPKRKPIERICSCGKTFIPKIKSSRILCDSCQISKMNSDKYKAMTLGEYHKKESLKGKHPSWNNAHIRSFNRSWNKDKVLLPCANCGYDKHVELAHIKEITSFDESTTLGEINSPENVIQLCPNCHWEFDYNNLQLNI